MDSDGDGVGDACDSARFPTVQGWGHNGGYQPWMPQDVGAVKAVAGGGDHVVALTVAGQVRCWGNNASGQSDVPNDLGSVVQVTGNYNTSLSLDSAGIVRAWGDNTFGQRNIPANLLAVVAIEGGWDHNLALQAGGQLRAWGRNSEAQCNVPANLGTVLGFSGGGYHSMALTAGGVVRCWGYNAMGQSTVPSTLPAVKQVAGGGYHSLALLSDGDVRAWGANDFGQSTVPSDLGLVVEIAAGRQSLALLANGQVRCWGSVGLSECDVPADLQPALHIACGSAHSLALIAPAAIADPDGDGRVSSYDNCPSVANAGQSDADGDGVGDACDFMDCNGDGLEDAVQCRNGTLADFNSNRIPDCCEQGTPCVVGIYPVQWRIADGGNGHWYQWEAWGSVQSLADAVAESNALGGHLATLTSAEEESFVRVLVPAGSCIAPAASEALIGLVQAEQSNEPAGGWSWISGEAFRYSNWRAGEPNDAGNEDACLLNVASGWNDGVVAGLGCSNAAIYEWSADCNGDGIVDFGQISHGELADANANGIPDQCECRADLNGDGVVGASDLPLLLNSWGTTGASNADLDGDGFVGPSDLAALLTAWGSCGR